jgi:lipopolysaccharide transport system ATP-binding protein
MGWYSNIPQNRKNVRGHNLMTDTVIRAESLGKKYLIGHQSTDRERYTALRDVISRIARSLLRSTEDMLRGRQLVTGDEIEEFWALRNIFFEIKRGEVVGVIGRNGAGKSTLLKILSRITEPSTGRVEIKGRVASLLEVGTGFHPELTGRENVFLNGAILGMSRVEIRRKFDEIVSFAGVERFLDTPVKRYSSGMHVRLAFAVAAHLEPEILIVDEVLAVGDAEFQKKCLGKMGEISRREARTVLFVSHNLAAVRALCNRGILLADGRLIFDGSVDEALKSYSELPTSNPSSISARMRNGSGSARLINIIYDLRQARQGFVLSIKAAEEMRAFRIIIAIYRPDQTCLLRLDSLSNLAPIGKGECHSYRVQLPMDLAIAPGLHYVNVALFNGYECCDHIERALEFEVRVEDLGDLARSLHGGEVISVDALWSKIATLSSHSRNSPDHASAIASDVTQQSV